MKLRGLVILFGIAAGGLMVGGLVGPVAQTQTPSPEPMAAAGLTTNAVHDLAVVKVKTPKKIALSSTLLSRTARVAVSIQNRSDHEEMITDQATLGELVSLDVQSLGPCSNAVALLQPNAKLPVTLASKKKLTVFFSVTFDCVNDPVANSKTDLTHGDYQTIATVHHDALDGQPDAHVEDDACPHDTLPNGVDQFPDGTVKDKGCGGKKPDGTLGADLITDLTYTSAGILPGDHAPVAVDDSANTLINTSVGVSVLANDTDPDGDTLSVASVTQPAHGSVSVTANVATYTPANGFTGVDAFTYTISDGRGGIDTATVTIAILSQPNLPPNAADDSVVTPNNTPISIAVLANDTNPDGDALNLTALTQPANGSVTSSNNVVNFVPNFAFSGTNTFTYSISDGRGGAATATVTVIVSPPLIVAPPLNPGAATDFSLATAFLYTGSNAVQTGVANGVIDPKRVAVLRGRVKTKADEPLSGVTVTILNHPEFGQTVTRVDGLFDMAVNGGGLIVVKFAKANFLSVQRQVQTPWQDYVCLPEVVMLTTDPAVTPLTLGTNSLQQVARGSVQTDADGSRQATLIFPPGTSASMIVNGATQAISAANVRATEFTVGAAGPAAMPAQLPANSGYTYCVELNADEAVAAGASSVQFDQLVSLYVENFLNFPVGQAVPIGSYNREKSVWEASSNGRVIKILSLNAGFAVLDTDGDGLADNAGQLTALGITDAERQKLATMYAADQSLWRVCVKHFTPWDCNWPYGPPSGSESPNDSPQDDDPPPNSCEGPANSVIKAEVQTFGEDLNIVGTPYQLHYESDRVVGNKVAYTIQIPLTEATLPLNLKRVALIVEVAGRVSTQEFPASPSQSNSFTWDGLDVYGRFIAGKSPISVRIGYVYDAVYLAPSDFDQAFAEFSGQTVVANSARGEVTLWEDWKGTVGILPSEAVGLGGWTLNVHHAYDPREKALYMGDGHRRTTAGLDTTIINTFAGGGIVPGVPIGDGGPADAAELSVPSGVAIGPDGSIFIAERGGHRIRRVTPDGIISTFAGSSTAVGCFPSTAACGDGGPATDALLNNPAGVAVAPDGTVYIADRFDNRIRKVDLNGIITTVAGTGVGAFGGDGGAATLAQLSAPNGVAIGPDGSLYIADTSNSRIRKVSTTGIITSLVGGGFGFSGDGGPAVLAKLNQPWRITATPDGTLYIVDRANNRIRRIGPDGIITTVAGAGGGDGGPALSAQLSSPEDVAVAPDGTFYIADRANERVRLVGTEGIITTVAGTGVAAFGDDGGPATRARLGEPIGLALAPDGTLYIVVGGELF